MLVARGHPPDPREGGGRGAGKRGGVKRPTRAGDQFAGGIGFRHLLKLSEEGHP